VVKLAAKPATVKHKKATKLFGTVSPNETGQHVAIQQLVKGKWKSVAGKSGTATIKKQKLPSGKKTVGYVFTLKESKPGHYTFRVTRAATTTNAAGRSTSITLHVT
jgi:hypothetical protein